MFLKFTVIRTNLKSQVFFNAKYLYIYYMNNINHLLGGKFNSAHDWWRVNTPLN